MANEKKESHNPNKLNANSADHEEQHIFITIEGRLYCTNSRVFVRSIRGSPNSGNRHPSLILVVGSTAILNLVLRITVLADITAILAVDITTQVCTKQFLVIGGESLEVNIVRA
jgi:hypothetical protein